MTQQLKTALVGVGKVTDMHARALAKLKESDFTAVCGRSKEKTEGYAAKYYIKAYTDVAEMGSNEKIDVVIICTPHPNHKEPTIAALEAGAHVLIEKPLASSLEDCDAMIEASKRCGKQIGVVCQRRWYNTPIASFCMNYSVYRESHNRNLHSGHTRISDQPMSHIGWAKKLHALLHES